ncbi:MAG: nitrogen regulation protein NR(II) [bacterium]
MDGQHKGGFVEDNFEHPTVVKTFQHPPFKVERISPYDQSLASVQQLLEGSPQAVCQVNRELEICWVNRAFAELMDSNSEHLIGKKYCEVLCDPRVQCEKCPAGLLFETGQTQCIEKKHNGRILNITSKPVCSDDEAGLFAAIYVTDITQTRSLEQSLIQSEKLATLGLLSSGIAHDIRNPLNVIETARYFLSEFLKEKSPEVRDKLEMIRKNVRRSDKIIDNLLRFARKSEHDKELINLTQLINSTVALIGMDLTTKNIEFEFDRQHNIFAFFSIDSLKQVLLNIIMNAVQAMPGGGRLIVKVEKCAEDIEIHITDTGIGILEENLQKIFEPLFTTKEKGVGTGLGLYISKMILERQGGHIRVKSQPSKGTTFTISLPMNDDDFENA